ncbi:hypothetical protein CP973_36370 [Streptomyces albofaciens JCM 4342]|uniref:hypothetical protein n=1 Tax=Streptomyces albofaciens TaxID=66866 RepID=UPI00123AFFFE|nr:hypothetical protein [Streptomyces albofaciens]KAA6214553.1 hypothetical protein CP973_36370 [Streptomyces albofaciens JCM 4342]
MGIESDQLVFDYLSRVGDLAQQRGLSSGARMRLVAELRAQVDAAKPDTVPGVRRVLSRLGTPEAVVEAAGGSGPPASPGPSGAAEPRPRPGAGDQDTISANGPAKPTSRPSRPALPNLSALGEGLRGRLAGKIPSPRDGAPRDGAPREGKRRSGRAREPEPPPTASPPHLAGFDELGDGSAEPDWWRVQEDPYGPYGPGETVPGFIGGIEIPEIRERPPGEREEGGPLSLEKGERGGDDDAEGEDGEDGEEGGEHGEEAAEAPRGVLPRVLARWRRSGTAPEPYAEEPEAVEYAPVARPPLSPVLLLAVLLLVAGAVTGVWLALAGGWVLAYTSRRLPRGEAKFAALGVPGVIVGGLVVWLWGRVDGRWGEPIAEGQLGHELTGVLPVVVRVAAVASALFLVWRMRRQPR